MSIGRSKFYVSTPLEYRHSMLADISPASSSSALSSVAGSVDCLTNPHKKKKKKSFSSKFSIRPFFSSISSLNKSSAESRRRDSSSQTDDRTANEVGVQTQIAPTVDVPVQTGFGGEWAENHGSRAFPASSSFSAFPSRPPGHFTRPGNDPFPFRRPRGPAAGHFARRSTEAAGEHVLTPLDAGRVLKYATPGDSATDGPTSLKVGVGREEIPPDHEKRVGTSEPLPCQSSYQESTLISTEYSSKSDIVTDPETSDEKSEPQISADIDNQNQGSSLISSSNEYLSKSDTVINIESETDDKKSAGPQVSAKLVNFFDKPSALKVERTDSPVRHSAKFKTVHFDLSDFDSNHNAANEIPLLSKKDVKPACFNGSRNLDKDFEDLLRNLDILVDDPPIDSCEKPEDLKISFDLCQSSPPKQTLLSTRLRSAFDVLYQEVLPPILETYENYEVEPSLNETHTSDALPASNEAHTTQTNEQVININHVDDTREEKLPSPSTVLSNKNNLNIIPKEDSAKPASGNVFTSSKSVGANHVNRKNVYESELSENVIKTVSLPTLPSFFDSVPKNSQLDVYSVSTEDFQSEAEEKMLSRSSSRGSVRSNPTSDLDGFLKSAKNRFDSCENLDQLEEEIIRSLCEPCDLAHKIPTRQLPADEILAHDVADVRRVALERLLSGDARSNDEMCRTPDEMIEIPKSKISARQTHKHVATLTKLDCHRNEPELECPKQTASDNLCVTPAILEMGNNDSLNKTSEFYLPKHKPLSTDNLMRVSNGHTSSPQRYFHESPADEDASGAARTCDFAHCLRPSEIRNSPFLDKISFRSSPDKSPVRSVAPLLLTRTKSPTSQAPRTETVENPNSNGQCNFEHCLKPSQMQNSAFLNDITARKIAPDISQFASNSTLCTSPFAPSSSSPPAVDSTDFKRTEKTKSDETSHKSEITIVLKAPYEGLVTDEMKSIKEVETPLLSFHQPASVPETNQKDETVPPGVKNPPANSVVQPSLVPPPPPLPSFSNKQGVKCHPSNVVKSTMETVLQNHPPRSLVKDQQSMGESKNSPNTSPVMMELEKCFEARRRHSADEVDQQLRTSNIVSKTSPENGRNSFEFHPSPTAATYQWSRGRGREQQLDSPTIVTDLAPPPGAVLLDERVTVDTGAGLRHTDRLFGLPVREVLKETTRTAHFRPAPPKYEGIGPTEDGMPLAPRNSVKKEHMHDWYKTMYKSLHKADSSNDTQEYIIGYSSEPETSQKETRKKSATLDSRSNHVVKGNDYSRRRPSYEVRLIEDYEPGHSSVTDNDVTVGSKRYLPALHTPKSSYEYTKGYEQENRYTRNLSPHHHHQMACYAEVQRGGEVPHFGLGKAAPQKPKDAVVGPLPPPPVNYNGPAVSPQATRPLTLPASYQAEDNGQCQPSKGACEMNIHSELQHRISPSSASFQSPDLRIPARALFDFKAESEKEIPLQKDDVVLIARQLDRNWYEGERGGRAGIFPLSYVEIVPPEHTPFPSSIHGSARLLYDFTAHAPVELSARKGECVALLRKVDANWYEAKLDGRKGIVPSSYLHVTHEPPQNSAPSPQPCLRSPSSPKGGRRTPNTCLRPPLNDDSVGKKSGGLIEPVMYRALYSYTPLHSDELELREGESVCVVERCDDGWFVGAAADSGRFGIFPGNYVEVEGPSSRMK